MNTENTYYFIDDFNEICKCENGMKSDESIILETYELVDDINRLIEENEQLKQQLFEAQKELLWATSDEVDRALHYEDEVEELRKEIFE